MAIKSPQQNGISVEPLSDTELTAAWPAPAPAPIGGTQLDQHDTWMTFGLGVEGEEDDRTVTVVFNRWTEDATDEFQPFSPTFPGHR